ncbi:carbohydrate ABC transporter permease [Marispirochaeta sp.]|uniref:carbohydrate ABC transporter permease n=1 Tax=Marispirochaeta sp. TaxID=2038653 RepID=UPI0029C6FFD2|nr:carbohydrate ABC transporter permease [Marispirochaeta sp.]
MRINIFWKTRFNLNIVYRMLVYFIILTGAILMVIPFIWMLLTSFKSFSETLTVPIKWFPSQWKLNNYNEVLQKFLFGRYYINTIIVTATITLGQAFICSLAAYAFARLRFPLKNIFFFMVLSVLMVPPQMTLVPQFLIISSFGFVNTLWGIIIPGLPSSFATFLFRQAFMMLPGELEESAKIDGCSHFLIYWKIMLPLCTSTIAAFSIITVLWAWNDLLWPLIVTSTDNMRVLSVGIAALQGQNYTEHQLLMAASVMATLPVIIVFIIGQKYFVRGIAFTGTKA